MGSQRRRLLVALGAGAVTTLAGCGGDGDSNTTSSPTDDVSQNETASSEETEGSTDDEQAESPSIKYQSAKLIPDDGDSDDRFGQSIEISSDGDTAVLATPNAGSAYVFTQSDGTWEEEAKLTAEDSNSDDNFGYSVGMSDDGSSIIIGANRDKNSNNDNEGSAYVFTRSDSTWEQQAKFTGNSGDATNRFGHSVGLSSDGNTAVIGAVTRDDPDGIGVVSQGLLYVYTWSDESWQQQAKIAAKDSNGSGGSFRGSLTVSSDGSTAIIGDVDYEDGTGIVYVFSQSEGNWQQRTRFTPTSGDSTDTFGCSIDLSNNGGTAIIGAFRDEDPNGRLAGSAYIFTQSNEGWQEQTKLAAKDGDDGDFFGHSVGISSDGSTAIIGANDDNDPNGFGTGSAYVFTQSDGSWQQQTKLAADDAEGNRPGDDGRVQSDSFGSPIAVSSDASTAIIGAPGDKNQNGESAGSAYVFEFK